MPATLFSITAIFAALFMAVLALCQKQQRSLGSLFLAAALLLMAGIEGADRIALNNPDSWILSKSVALMLESLLGSIWLLFALTFARKNPFHSLSPFSLALLISTLLLPLIALLSDFDAFYFSP